MEVVKVKCRNCSKLVRSDELILDLVYKSMVCPACVKEREIKEKMPLMRAVKVERAAGYDQEDGYLENIQRMKAKEVPKLKLIQEASGQYRCPKCNYKFKYSPEKGTPIRCPYCDTNFLNK